MTLPQAFFLHLSLKKEDLTLTQLVCLYSVSEGADTVTKLSQALKVSTSAASVAVETLVVAGLLKRSVVEDRRVHKLEVTEAGREKMNGILE